MKNIFYSAFFVFLLMFTFACQRKAAPVAAPVAGSNSDVGVQTISEDVILLEGGKTKLHAGDHQGAIEELNKAIDLKPKNADAYYWRAVAKGYLGDNAGCCEDYAKAAKLGNPSAAEMIEKYCK